MHRLALMGGMHAIQEQAAHIEMLGEPYAAFAHKRCELAQGFEKGAILALVEQYMERRR